MHAIVYLCERQKTDIFEAKTKFKRLVHIINATQQKLRRKLSSRLTDFG
jgi:hypothetical protein